MSDITNIDIVSEDYQRFYNFIKTVILPFEPESHKQYAPFHYKLIYTACEPMTATAAARGSLKSTILAKYRALYRLIDPHPDTTPIKPISTLILSATKNLSKEHLDWIKYNITDNPHLIARYGVLSDPNNLKWNEDTIELLNGSKCYALGYGSQVRGRHPTDIIVDDLESRDNIGTEETLASLKDWFYRELMGAMLPETRMTVIGTIVRQGSLLQELVEKEEFNGRIWKALNDATDEDRVKIPSLIYEGLVSIWPQRWPVEYLLKRKKALGTHKFNAEYQNQPVGLEDPIIMAEWIKRHTDQTLSTFKPVRRYIACDPAFTEEKWGCYSAIIVMDEAPDGVLYERLAWRKKVAAPELIKTLINFYRHFSAECPEVRFGIEEVAAQKAVRQSITELEPTIGAAIIPLRPDKDKVRRMIDVSRYYEMGLVSLKTESYIDEILNFPHGDLDRCDAGVYCLKMYERDHLNQLGENRVVEVDTLNKLGDNEYELYLNLAAQGMPGYHVPAKRMRDMMEAYSLMDSLEIM